MFHVHGMEFNVIDGINFAITSHLNGTQNVSIAVRFLFPSSSTYISNSIGCRQLTKCRKSLISNTFWSSLISILWFLTCYFVHLLLVWWVACLPIAHTVIVMPRLHFYLTRHTRRKKNHQFGASEIFWLEICDYWLVSLPWLQSLIWKI